MADKLRKWKYYHCHMVSHIAQMAERFCLPTTINSRVNADNWSLMLCSCQGVKKVSFTACYSGKL